MASAVAGFCIIGSQLFVSCEPWAFPCLVEDSHLSLSCGLQEDTSARHSHSFIPSPSNQLLGSPLVNPTPGRSSQLTLLSLALTTRPLVGMRMQAINGFAFADLCPTSRGHGNKTTCHETASEWPWEFKDSLFLSRPKNA